MTSTVSTSDIAAAFGVSVRTVSYWTGLPGFPSPATKRGRGGERVYRLAGLPVDLRNADGSTIRAGFRQRAIDYLISQQAPAASASAPATAAALPPDVATQAAAPAAGALTTAAAAGDGLAQLKDWQRDCAYARRALLAHLEDVQARTGCTQNDAIATLISRAAEKRLDEHVERLVTQANERKGGGRTLSRATVLAWKRAFNERGLLGLAPAGCERLDVPAWAGAALQLWQRPQKPTIAYVVEKLPAELPAGIPVPSYHQVRRFIGERLGNVAREVGRRGPRDLKNILAFKRRDTSKMWPCDGYTADGHTFDAEVAHPVHGRPFRPELTSVLDIATRRAVGWTASLKETQLDVLDALRHAFTTSGDCAIFYTDNGPGYKNALQSDPGIGMAARLGYEVKHSLPYNSQSRGIIERSHQTIFVKAARELPTYIGAAMDAEAKNKVFKLTRRDLKEVGKSRLLMPWDVFIQYIQAAIDDYNNRPHRSLPRVRDSVTGSMRHQSPNEAWQSAIDDGWTPHVISAEDARELFRPRRLAEVRRCEIRAFGHTYFSRLLEEEHDNKVAIGYDVHDPSSVMVYDLQGRYLCDAHADANRSDYFGESVLEQAAAKRAAARRRRLEDKLQEVDEELRGSPLVLDNNPSPKLDADALYAAYTAAEVIPEGAGRSLICEGAVSPASEHLSDQETNPQDVAAQITALPAEKRPFFAYDYERYEWLMQHREGWTDGDTTFCRYFVATDEYQLMADIYAERGIAWDGGAEGFKAAL